jgi:hypothetical protein
MHETNIKINSLVGTQDKASLYRMWQKPKNCGFMINASTNNHYFLSTQIKKPRLITKAGPFVNQIRMINKIFKQLCNSCFS